VSGALIPLRERGKGIGVEGEMYFLIDDSRPYVVSCPALAEGQRLFFAFVRSELSAQLPIE
jgi:hypothetical protein